MKIPDKKALLLLTVIFFAPRVGVLFGQGADCREGFVEVPSYEGTRTPGFVVVQFSDRYRWLIKDVVVGGRTEACQQDELRVVRGARAEYHHLLGTSLIRMAALDGSIRPLAGENAAALDVRIDDTGLVLGFRNGLQTSLPVRTEIFLYNVAVGEFETGPIGSVWEDRNFDNRADAPPCPLVAQDPSRAFVDCNGNQIADATEATLTRLTERRLLLVDPQGGTPTPAGARRVVLSERLLTERANFAQAVAQWGAQTNFLRGNFAFFPDAQVLGHTPLGVVDLSGQRVLIETAILISNPSDLRVPAGLLFINQDGSPAEVTLEGRTASYHPLVIEPGSTRELRPEAGATTPPRVLWALGFGVGLEFASVFSTFVRETTGDVLAAEAGIAASPLGSRHLIRVSRTREGRDTGLSVVNVTGFPAETTFTLRSEEGTLVATLPMRLQPYSQNSLFVSQIFDKMPENFSGSLEIRSDSTLAVLSLSTHGGLQASSLPSAAR